MNAQVSKSVEVTPGSLSSALSTTELNTITNLTLTGSIDARDFKTMRDHMPMLSVLAIDEAKIAAYLGSEGTSLWVSNYPANTVPESAFMNNSYQGKTGLISIALPSNLTSFAPHSFMGCSGITDLIIPPSVTSIGSYAFLYCTRLHATIIPPAVNDIGREAFSAVNCDLNVVPDNPNYSSNNGVLFNKTKTAFIQCPISKTVNYTIPSSVKSIGPYAFFLCRGLTTLTIPPSVTSIEDAAFSNCSGLSSIYASSITPVILDASIAVFYKVNKLSCTLYVPYGSKSAYRTASQWRDFTNIVELQSLGSNVPQDQVINKVTHVSPDGSGSTNANNNAISNQLTIPESATSLFSLLKVYPNPFVRFVTVEMGRTIDSPYQVLIYNMEGELLLDQEVHTTKAILDLSKLTIGNYLIKVCLGTEEHSTVIVKK
jgi:hypothetical protein